MATIIFPYHLIRKENIVTDNIHQNTHSSPNDTHPGDVVPGARLVASSTRTTCVQETTSSSQNGLLMQSAANSPTVKHKHTLNGNCLGDILAARCLYASPVVVWSSTSPSPFFPSTAKSVCGNSPGVTRRELSIDKTNNLKWREVDGWRLIQ